MIYSNRFMCFKVFGPKGSKTFLLDMKSCKWYDFICMKTRITRYLKNINSESLTSENNRGISLSKRLWHVLIIMLLVIIICFFVALIFVTNRAKLNYEKSESETRIMSIKSGLQSNIQNYKDLSRLIMINDEVIKLLRAEGKEVDAGMKNDAHYGVMDILNVSENVDSVFVFRNDGQYMSTGKGEYLLDRNRMNMNSWKKQILDLRGRAVISINGDSALFKKKGPVILTLSRAIYDINSQELSGILLMNISIDMLAKITKSQGNDLVCITDRNGNYLAGNQDLSQFFCEDFVKEEITHKRGGINTGYGTISGSAVEDLPLVIICKSSVETKNVIPVETVLVLFLLLFVFFVLAFLITVFMDKNLAKPIVELSSAMEKTKQSGFLEKIDIGIPNNEIGQLTDSYNNMISHLNDLFEELIDREKSQQKAEMRVLYEQIKPHFLYNSLETISYLAVEAGAPNVHDALETLGSFYRNFLSKGSRTITFKREIAIIKDYLSLQRLRYGDILSDEYDIAEDTLDIYIPKLILQPLVENSIYHGIRPKGEEGIIRISSFLEGEKLHIIVYDDGVGMSEETVDKILNAQTPGEENADNEKGSFGLIGTIERIRRYCNDFNAVKISSEEGEYTQIELIIPLSEQS